MARFIAQASVDMTDLDELGLFHSWSSLRVPNHYVGSSFKAYTSTVKMTVEGKGLTILGALPVGGEVTSITVAVNGDPAYVLKNVSIWLGDIRSTFKGDFEPSLFAKADQITGSSFADKLLGYGGNDRIAGGGGNDGIQGGKGNDTLLGSSGLDTLKGQQGNDWLDGGLDDDTLSGGGGADKFVFDYALSAANIDTITDFTLGVDKIYLDNGTFFGLGGQGPLASGKFVLGLTPPAVGAAILYDKPNGDLWFDPDGTGGEDAVQFARVADNLALSASDFWVFAA